jgi:hypothetical protein
MDEEKKITWREIVDDVRERMMYKRLRLGEGIGYFSLSKESEKRVFKRHRQGDVSPMAAYESEFSDVLEDRKPCNVCAMGALMVGLLDLDESKRKQALMAGAGSDGIIKVLEGYFSEENLKLMERYFEGWLDDLPITVGQRNRWKRMTRPKRLEAILNNIEKNEGVFIP